MGQKPKEDKEKPASELTDKELLNRLFPPKVARIIKRQWWASDRVEIEVACTDGIAFVTYGGEELTRLPDHDL